MAVYGRAGALEAIVHHHLPIFHTEHCVFARFLSNGNSYKDCGRPCESATLHLRDGAGADHLVVADQGCRNTVFNSAAQSGALLHRVAGNCYRADNLGRDCGFGRPCERSMLYLHLLDTTVFSNTLLREQGSGT